MTERASYQRMVQGGDVTDDAFQRGLVHVWVATLYGR